MPLYPIFRGSFMEFSLRESKILQMGGEKKEAFNFLGRRDVTLITGGPYLALDIHHTLLVPLFPRALYVCLLTKHCFSVWVGGRAVG